MPPRRSLKVPVAPPEVPVLKLQTTRLLRAVPLNRSCVPTRLCYNLLTAPDNDSTRMTLAREQGPPVNFPPYVPTALRRLDLTSPMAPLLHPYTLGLLTRNRQTCPVDDESRPNLTRPGLILH